MNVIREVKSDRVGDRYYEVKHPSGLRIFVYPKEQNNSTYAVFGTRYGSVDTTFKRSDEAEACTVPAGIAHYLEHKLFESEDGDAFARYAKTGANANAYTSFDVTCYLFSCTENVYESLEILLDFVQSPYFTEQTVQKEQGIIGQEIRMYDDDPQWRVMFNLLEALYHKHPVKVDIAGTVESIAQITPELLNRIVKSAGAAADLVPIVVDYTVQVLHEQQHNEVYLTGQMKLLGQPEYRDVEKAQEVLATLDEEVIANLPAPRDGPVQILVGPENIAKELKDTSVVMTRFDIGDGMQGMIGVVGPTRMDYARVTARLSYFAEGLGRMFGKNELPPSSRTPDGEDSGSQ